MRYSADAQAAQACPYPALVSDARRQADAMASAAGMKAGPIVSVSDGGPSDIAVPTALARTGDFSISPIFIYDAYSGLPPSGSGVFGLVGFPYPLSAPPPACLLTVQFKLLQ
jgi:hypothetical protein